MSTQSRQSRLAILTNILTPYRAPLYRRLGEQYEARVILSGREDNRQWDRDSLGQGVRLTVARGITLKRRLKGTAGSTSDLRYIHINPGYLSQLFWFRPHAILSVEMGMRSFLALLYGRVFGVPVWVWWGGTPHTERRLSRPKMVLRQIFARVTPRWISYGDTSTAYLLSLRVPRDRILQIQNCVDEELYGGDAKAYEVDLPRPRALFVGQIIGRKGIRELLAAHARLRGEGIDCSLLVIGDGPEGSWFDAEVHRLGLREVRRIPHVPPEEMPGVYRACDFLIFPTLEDVWGLVVNEALLSGLPVVASSYAGCAQELLASANLFDPLDPDDFLDAYRRAAQKGLANTDTSRIKPLSEVAELIATDVERAIAEKRSK